MSRDELDMVAVQSDAALMDALATRSVGASDLDDPVVRALAEWREYVDDGLDGTVTFVMPGSTGAARAAQAGRGRRTMLVAGSTALALVVSGGAAAAVTGDPFAAVKAPLHALGKVNPFSGDETNTGDRLPNPTPTKAQANKLLADARRAMAQDHPVKAQRLLAEAKVLLGDDVNPGQQKFIDALTNALPERPGRAGGTGAQPGDRGNKPDPGADPGDRGNKPDPGTDPGDRGNKPDPGAEPGDRGNKPDPGTDPGDRGNKPDPGTDPGDRGNKPDPGSKPDKASGGKGSGSASTGSQNGWKDGPSAADPDQ